MSKGKAPSKSADEIINELFNELNLPTLDIKKPDDLNADRQIKGSLDSKNSCDELKDSLDSISDSTDQEIDKLLEEITDVTDKSIKVDAATFEITNDIKNKKKKLKRSNSLKSKHKKKKSSKTSSKKKEKHKRKRSISTTSSKFLSSNTEKTDIVKKKKEKCSRSRSSSSSRYPSKRVKLSRSRSRSKSKTYSQRSSSKSKHYQSRSRSISKLRRNQYDKSSRFSSRSRSQSPSQKFKNFKERSNSPLTRRAEEPLDAWKTSKLTALEKSVQPNLQEITVESTKDIPLPEGKPLSDYSKYEIDGTGKDSSQNVINSIVDKTLELNKPLHTVQKPLDSSDVQGKRKDTGKSKPIVIKSLKDSSVLQQAEEAQNKYKEEENKKERNEHEENTLNNNETVNKDIQVDANNSDATREKDKNASKEETKKDEEDLSFADKTTGNTSNEEDKNLINILSGHKSRSRSKSSCRSISKSGKKHSRSRSKTRLKIKSKRNRSKEKYKKRSKSKEKFKNRSSSRSRRSSSHNRSRVRHGKSGTNSRHYKKRRRRAKRSSSAESRESVDCVDSLRDKATRKRLLEVARKNAVYLMQNNCLPRNIEKESVRATGKSVEELTSFCRQLVSKEYSDGEMSDPSLSPDESENFSSVRHHPFMVKDSKPIMMNIRNAPMLPTKTNAERLADTSKLRELFPVSSGSDHRTVESEWVPVQKEETKEKESVKVFPEAEPHFQSLDISQLVATRLKAMRRLQDNPSDRDAMNALTSAQKDMQNWALSKQVPGQFTGSTGAKILSAEQLTSGYQAWARKRMTFVLTCEKDERIRPQWRPPVFAVFVCCPLNKGVGAGGFIFWTSLKLLIQ